MYVYNTHLGNKRHFLYSMEAFKSSYHIYYRKVISFRERSFPKEVMLYILSMCNILHISFNTVKHSCLFWGKLTCLYYCIMLQALYESYVCFQYFYFAKILMRYEISCIKCFKPLIIFYS